MPRPLALVTMWLGLALALTPAAAGQDYEIKMDRPVKVGQELGVTDTEEVSTKSVVTAGDKTLQSETRTVAYEIGGTVKVLEIDDLGRATRLSLTLTKCTRTEGQETKALIEKSTSVLAYAKGREKVFEIDGNPVPEALREALEEAVSVSRGGPSNDEIYGTKERKKVGDRWAINAEAAAKSLEREGDKIAKDDIQGTATLEKTVKEGGVDCLLVRCTMTIKGILFSLPEGLKCESGSMQVDFGGILPVDTTLGMVEETSLISLHLVATSRPDPQGPEMHTEVSMDSKSTTRYTYPPPAAKKE